jgi:hypothetical protein
VAVCTSIWNLVLIRHFRRDEIECVTADVDVCNRLFDFRHVAGYAVASRAFSPVMCMRFNCCASRSVGGRRPVTIQAKLACGFDQVRVICRPMYIVAAEAGHTASIHEALNEIISLHSVLMAGAVGKMGKRGFAQFVFFEPPKVS